MGNLSSVFVATDTQVAEAIGKEIYFGEVLGKHSDIHGPLAASDVTLASDDPAAVAIVESLKLCSGRNPLDYIDEDDDDREE